MSHVQKYAFHAWLAWRLASLITKMRIWKSVHMCPPACRDLCPRDLFGEQQPAGGAAAAAESRPALAHILGQNLGLMLEETRDSLDSLSQDLRQASAAGGAAGRKPEAVRKLPAAASGRRSEGGGGAESRGPAGQVELLAGKENDDAGQHQGRLRARLEANASKPGTASAAVQQVGGLFLHTQGKGFDLFSDRVWLLWIKTS